MFDIDWQGTKQLSNFNNLNLIKIFLIPQDKHELKNRLIKRDQNTDEEELTKDIIHLFGCEVNFDYDYVIINKI